MPISSQISYFQALDGPRLTIRLSHSDVLTLHLIGVSAVSIAYLFVRRFHRTPNLYLIYSLYFALGYLLPAACIFVVELRDRFYAKLVRWLCYALFPQFNFVDLFVRITVRNVIRLCYANNATDCDGRCHSNSARSVGEPPGEVSGRLHATSLLSTSDRRAVRSEAGDGVPDRPIELGRGAHRRLVLADGGRLRADSRTEHPANSPAPSGLAMESLRSETTDQVGPPAGAGGARRADGADGEADGGRGKPRRPHRGG